MTESTQPKPSAMPDATVIVPLYNAASTLRQCLDSIFANQGVDIEVILVNDCSKDHSVDIALQYPCRVVSLEKNIMAANCRNLGAQLAQADILVFFDSDQIMYPDMIAKYVAVLRAEPQVDAVVGSFQADTPIPGFYSKFKNLRHHYVHQTAQREGATLASGLTAIRKSVFEKLGGFEPAFHAASIEDIALGYKMRRHGHRIWFCGDILASHLKGYTFGELMMSDIRHRAIPWIGLMLRDRMWRRDLNTKGGNVASVALSWLIIPTAVAAGLFLGIGWGVLTAAILTLLIAVSNAGLLGAACRNFGLVFLIKSLLFLPVMYAYQGAGLLGGLYVYLTGRGVVGPRQRPEAKFQLLQGAGLT